MITKPPSDKPLPKDPRLRAGVQAELTMGFYLHRAFAQDKSIYILNDLRLVDPDQPELDGKPGVCQIDHLVIHRFGLFIIESKSVRDTVSVRDDGSGGDEWTRRHRSKEVGFPSPIQQARRQAEFLRNYLQGHREELLGLIRKGLRTIAKALAGTEQRGFRSAPIQLLVAISDKGKIKRVGGWKAPDEPFQAFAAKADLVPEKIREQMLEHKKARKLLGEMRGDYGVWSMRAEEIGAVAEYLLRAHIPRETQPSHAPRSAEQTSSKSSTEMIAACGSCGSDQLAAYWGKKAYRWKCGKCSSSTAMPVVCSVCRTEGSQGKLVRIRKQGPKYYRCCESCEIEECVWIEREQG